MKFTVLLLIFSLSLAFRCHLKLSVLNQLKSVSYPISRIRNVQRLDSAFGDIREQLSVPSEKICDAVEKSSSYRLSVNEAAAYSGLSLFEARQGLMTLSTLTGGDLEVTNSGEIIYSFPRNFRSILNQRSYGQKLANVNKFMVPKLYYLTKISIGAFLIVSIVIAFTSIFIVMNSSSSSDSNSNSDNKKRRSSSSDVYINFNSYGSSYYGNPFKEVATALESFFSFIFGDGDPNLEFSTRQAQELAKLIQLRNGVLTSEEMAVVLDCPYDPHMGSDGSLSSTSTGVIVDESWVLPALVRFNGEPVVDNEGQILYKFEVSRQFYIRSALIIIILFHVAKYVSLFFYFFIICYLGNG